MNHDRQVRDDRHALQPLGGDADSMTRGIVKEPENPCPAQVCP